MVIPSGLPTYLSLGNDRVAFWGVNGYHLNRNQEINREWIFQR